MTALLERGEGSHMQEMDAVPWELVRDIMRRAPGWARTIDGMSGSGEPPGGGSRATWDFPTERAIDYYDLARALKMLRDGGKACPRRPADAKVLALLSP